MIGPQAPSDRESEAQDESRGGSSGFRAAAWSRRRLIGLLAGPALFASMFLLPVPDDMTPEAQKMAAIALLMATWWMCEAIPIPATALLPLILMPMCGLLPMKDAAAPYASELIFLFMGGFLIALSMQRWNLHRRIALLVVCGFGFAPDRLVLGFMVASAGLSAFVSNTVTALMMMPIGVAVIQHVVAEGRRMGLDRSIDFSCEKFAFGTNLMLGIAYACSIGGIATLIGTPPNTVLAGYLQHTYGFEITFARWMQVGVPLAVVMLGLCWVWLTRFANPMRLVRVPGGRELIQNELRSLGPMCRGECVTAVVFGLTALAWILREVVAELWPAPSMISDAVIGMTGGLLLFVIPVGRRGTFAMNWEWANRLPWGMLLLFGGGLSLACGFERTGLSSWLAGRIELLSGAPILVLVLAVTLLIIFLTELTSNTATAAMAMPVLCAVALGIGENPLLLLVPAALAASCAFMLPVATPPNAIVFGSGNVTMSQMIKSGFALNLIGIVLITLLTYSLVVPLFGIVYGLVPSWTGCVGG
ncbi:MAG: solute carrier family 13 (sodium-dependent dicarboxylate transporter), er 2/3/5 [Desulfuromonadales bacterium]|jgi:sodium-dependent dicarboxylate transporter 2/3/5|nr:solute carrier family 13 (sodium-dependent dicarboxylate transporter), er 2/3/5 [Desulfuromonadales bacterium]